MPGEKPVLKGTDGLPMTIWQICLKRLCWVMIAWGVIGLILGIVIIVEKDVIPSNILFSLSGFMQVSPEDAWFALGISMVISAVINLFLALLGIRGAKNPSKITLFFWIVLLDAVLTAWSLASNISIGTIDPSGFVSGIFIIAVAICAWEVRKQTGYFDKHP